MLTAISAEAFHSAGNLTSIEIPEGVTSIGAHAFDSTGLTSIGFAAGSQLTTIGAAAFLEVGFTSITLPASVVSIGANSFYGDSGLSKVVFLGNAPTVGVDAFYNLPVGAKAVLIGGLTGFGGGNGDLFNGLVIAHGVNLDSGLSPVTRGNLIKSSGSEVLDNPVFEWQRCSGLNDEASCSAISGGVGAWWGTRNADIGKQLRFQATSGATVWLSDMSGVVGPSNSAAPVINQGLVGGAPKKDSRLHASFGTWGGYVAGSSTVGFQWQRCSTSSASSCTTNIGANSQWYRPIAADVGSYLRLTATLTTYGQSTSASTAVSGKVASSLVTRRAHTALAHKANRRGGAQTHKVNHLTK